MIHVTYNLRRERQVSLVSSVYIQKLRKQNQNNKIETGQPKAAVMSHFNFVNNGIHVANRMELNEKFHKICVQVPLFHAYGIVISICAAIQHGATIVLPSAGFNPEQSLRAIVDEK